MRILNCHDRFDEFALHRWEGEGGCMGLTPHRGRDGPRSHDREVPTGRSIEDAANAFAPAGLSLSPRARISLTVQSKLKGTSHVPLDEPGFENSVRSARSGQYRRLTVPSA
jgi:hypothetical protein